MTRERKLRCAKTFSAPPDKRLLKMALCLSLLTAPCLASAQQLAPGWNPLLRPNSALSASQYTNGNGLYDWTGLTDIVSRYDGSYFDKEALSTLFGGVPYFNIINDFGQNYPYTSDIIGGGSTYKWQWEAPPSQNPADGPDITNFPAPTLFTLGTLVGGYAVSKYADESGLGAFSSIGFLNANSIGSGNVIPDMYTFQGWSVLSSTFDAPNETATSVLNVQGVFAGTGVYASYPYSGQSSFSFMTLATPILLQAPDPLKRPDTLRDGGNQFAYDDSGNLKVDAKISCAIGNFSQPGSLMATPPVPAYAADLNRTAAYLSTVTNWQTDILTCNIARGNNPASPNRYDFVHTYLLPYTLTASADNVNKISNVLPSTNSANDMGHLIFQGMPASNTDFGNHTVTLTVTTFAQTKKDGGGTGRQESPVPTPVTNLSMVAHIQTFYNAAASTYPGAVALGVEGYEPNWMYYYTQVMRQTIGFPLEKVVYDGTIPNNTSGFYDVPPAIRFILAPRGIKRLLCIFSKNQRTVMFNGSATFKSKVCCLMFKS